MYPGVLKYNHGQKKACTVAGMVQITGLEESSGWAMQPHFDLLNGIGKNMKLLSHLVRSSVQKMTFLT